MEEIASSFFWVFLWRGSSSEMWKKVLQFITLVSHLRMGRPGGFLAEAVVNWSNVEVALEQHRRPGQNGWMF